MQLSFLWLTALWHLWQTWNRGQDPHEQRPGLQRVCRQSAGPASCDRPGVRCDRLGKLQQQLEEINVPGEEEQIGSLDLVAVAMSHELRLPDAHAAYLHSCGCRRCGLALRRFRICRELAWQSNGGGLHAVARLFYTFTADSADCK